MLPFYPGGLLFGRVLQAVHGRGVHKIAQVGASGGRPIGASKSDRRRVALLLGVVPLLPILLIQIPSDGGGRTAAFFIAIHRLLATDHRHSGRPRIINVVASMNEERIDFPRCCHHRSLSKKQPKRMGRNNSAPRKTHNTIPLSHLLLTALFIPFLFCFFGEGSPRNRVCACQRRPINAHRFTARAPSPTFVMRRAYWRCHRVILVRGVGPLVPILFDNNKLVGTGVCVLFISPSVIKYLAGKNRNGRWSIIDEP